MKKLEFDVHEIRESIQNMTVTQMIKESQRLELKYNKFFKNQLWTYHDMPENDDKAKLIELYHAMDILA